MHRNDPRRGNFAPEQYDRLTDYQYYDPIRGWIGHWPPYEELSHKHRHSSDRHEDRQRESRWADYRGEPEDWASGATDVWTPDATRWPRFLGRGPKNYKRSDERIQDDVYQFLSDGSIDASDIEITTKDGVVTLSGTVDNRAAKFRAETLAGRCRGISDVVNQIRVKPGHETIGLTPKF